MVVLCHLTASRVPAERQLALDIDFSPSHLIRLNGDAADRKIFH